MTYYVLLSPYIWNEYLLTIWFWIGTYFTAYDGVQDTNFPTPVVENVYKAWKPVSYGHPLKDATMFYAPPSLERVVINGGLGISPGNTIDRSDRGK